MPIVIPGTLRDGVMYPSSPIPTSAIEVVTSDASYTVYTDDDLHTYPPAATPKSTIVGVYQGSRQTQESYFGLHVQFPYNIPIAIDRVPFYSARSHDSSNGMQWFKLNPSNGVFNWTNSDAWVDEMYAQGKPVLFLLGFTPNWASASHPNTGIYDNGGTVTASNQPPSNVAYWDSFCAAVATRYAGKITHYEVWNEVNYPNYWAGSASQLAVLVRRANQVIKSIDPNALIIAPTVQEVESSGTGTPYLASFLDASDGASGTGKDWVDVCSIHMYPNVYNWQIHKNQIDNVQAVLTARSMPQKIWNSETGVLIPSYGVDAGIGAKWLKRSLLLSAALGVERYYWYCYDNATMFMRPEQITAWNEVRNLLLAGPITGCNYASDGRVAATVGGINVVY